MSRIGLPPIIDGISFDIEHTLFCYKNADGDASNYVAAVEAYNLRRGKSMPIPTWPTCAERDKSFSSAWNDAVAEQRARLEQFVDDSAALVALWDTQRLAPWMSMHDAMVFYRCVVRRFFATGGVERVSPSFVDFLVYEYYGGSDVYCPPRHRDNMASLLRIRSMFPNLPMFALSNTDARARDLVMSDVCYRGIFRGTVLTACDVEELKPSGKGIALAVKLAGCINAERGRTVSWLHVGDEPAHDGGAVASFNTEFESLGRCYYLPCDPTVGVDFSEVLTLLSSGDVQSLPR